MLNYLCAYTAIFLPQNYCASCSCHKYRKKRIWIEYERLIVGKEKTQKTGVKGTVKRAKFWKETIVIYVLIWTTSPRWPLAGSSPITPSSPGLHHGPTSATWQLETEDWSFKTILAKNRGSWPATRLATAKRRAQDRSAWGKLVATATSSQICSWRRSKSRKSRN